MENLICCVQRRYDDELKPRSAKEILDNFCLHGSFLDHLHAMKKNSLSEKIAIK